MNANHTNHANHTKLQRNAPAVACMIEIGAACDGVTGTTAGGDDRGENVEPGINAAWWHNGEGDVIQTPHVA